MPVKKQQQKSKGKLGMGNSLPVLIFSLAYFDLFLIPNS